ncbi:FtsX-like permease family protein [Streptomyces sp. NPDC002306]
MRTDIRLAWELTRGSDRREWWRVGLTAAGAALATGILLAAVALASVRGQYHFALGHGLLDQPGQRAGVITSLLLLLVPVLGFLGQCALIGAVHRDRRLAGLRLAGATPGQVRRIAALETGLACLLGAVLATGGSLWVLLRLWTEPTPLTWVGFALVTPGVPILGAAAGALALRRVAASPLGPVRRVRAVSGRGPGLLFLGGLLLVVVLAVAASSATAAGEPARGEAGRVPLTLLSLVVAVGVGAVWLAGAVSGLTGRLLAPRARSAATLIAAERLRDDPWAAARTHAAVLLVTVVGTGFAGVRATLLAYLDEPNRGHRPAGSRAFYTTGLDLTAVGVLVGLGIVLCALAVGTAESVAARRRGLATLAAAGVPRRVLGRALLLETALPLAPAVLLAGAGGLTIGVWYASQAAVLGSAAVPYAALLIPPAVYVCCLLAAATSLPLLRRSLHPAQLRHT